VAAMARLDGPSPRQHTSISCFCKDAGTLFWGAQTLGRNIGGLRGAAPSLLVAVLGVFAAVGAIPASALATGAKAKAKRKPAPCAQANLQPSAANAAKIDAATLCLIDRTRSANHLRPLRANRELQSVASSETVGLVGGNYFSDASPTGQSSLALVAAIPYGAHAARLSTAQNLGWGTLSDATPAGMVAAWMSSPPHREVILTAQFRDAGVGVVPAVPPLLGQGSPGATYAVEFAVRSRH